MPPQPITPIQQTPIGTPIAAQQPTSPQTVTQSPKKGALILILSLVGIIVLIAVLAGLVWFYVDGQKKLFQSALTEHVAHFKDIEVAYSDVVDILRSSMSTNEGASSGNRLLGAYSKAVDSVKSQDTQGGTPKDQSSVLGMEASPVITQLRNLTELYRTAGNKAKDIENTTKQIKKITDVPLANMYVPTDAELIKKTKQFVTDTQALMTYLAENNDLAINATMLGYEIGVEIQTAIYQYADAGAVSRLETKINELKKLKQQAQDINISGLSDELRKEHKDSLVQFDKEVQIFYDILNDMKKKDGEKLVKDLQLLAVDASTSMVTSQVDEVSFWQNNPTIRSVKEIKQEWERYVVE